jgi:hypothetical protein
MYICVSRIILEPGYGLVAVLSTGGLSMRTPTAELMSSDRYYMVSGSLSFVFPLVSVIDVGELWHLIADTDQKFPWRDEPPCKSMGTLSNGEIAIEYCGGLEQVCHFTFQPGFCHLSKGQLHAYEKYVVNLATELAQITSLGFWEVRCSVDISRRYTFKAS